MTLKDDPALLTVAPETAPLATLILAHGAGAPMDSLFMTAISHKLVARGLEVVRFNFPYMARAVAENKRRPPDRAPRLIDAFRTVIDRVRSETGSRRPLLIGGKSMGGRIATMVAAETDARPDGVFVLGYPFHPPGKPDRLRTDHFPQLCAPVTICQGERDPFGNKTRVENLSLPAAVTMVWMTDGNHDLSPRRACGLTQDTHLDSAAEAAFALAMSRPRD